MEKKILVRTEENIGFLELNNIKNLNAISLSMWNNLGGALEKFAANSLIRCVMIKVQVIKLFQQEQIFQNLKKIVLIQRI